MKVYIGADHRGFSLKEKITRWLFEWEHDFYDVGARYLDLNDDYTKYASQVASLVAEEEKSKGILLCGSGVGVAVTANKFDGVRASIGFNTEQVKDARSDDDLNILIIAADHIKKELAKKMVKAFLTTKFKGSKKYKKRLEDISKIEANN